MSRIMWDRINNMMKLARVWRWRRVRWYGVVLACRCHAAPVGTSYTWLGRRNGDANRDQLAGQLTRATRRRQREIAANWGSP